MDLNVAFTAQGPFGINKDCRGKTKKKKKKEEKVEEKKKENSSER